jgi:hypothetical protein
MTQERLTLRKLREILRLKEVQKPGYGAHFFQIGE